DAAGMRVLFNGVAAPLVYVSAGQINCVVPYEAAGPDIAVQINYAGKSILLPLTGTGAAPAIFTATGTGTGAVAALNSNGTYTSSATPEPAGGTVTFYMTGEGQTNPGGITGSVTGAAIPRPRLPVSVTIGGRPANVVFYGEAPGLVAGVMQ